ncbi:MAG: acetylornithine deacetylase [Pseudomonadota bacterium]|nr:acetylornithine deacetylase [Pseudomonadota bacterium]
MMPDSLTRAQQLLAALVAFPTVSDRSNLDLIAYVADYLRALGVEPMIAPNREGDKAALLATFGPRVDGGVLLSAHTDVVPVEGQPWTSDPFALRAAEGRLYGRGACDMKGFAACALACVPDFLAAGLARPIHLLLSYDEETTCLGSLDFIQRFGVDLPRPAAVIVGEPTLMQVADAHKGVATFRTLVRGVEAHSAQPSLGANAISAACEIVAEIDRLARELEGEPGADPRFDPPFSTYHVGTIAGGSARNILARECAFGWEFRGLPEMTAAQALARVQRFIDQTALPRLRRHRPEPTIETVMDVDVPGLAREPGSSAATLALRLARANATIAVSYATEAGHFQRAGVSTIVCGPGSIEQAHKPDEYVAMEQLGRCVTFLIDLAREL